MFNRDYKSQGNEDESPEETSLQPATKSFGRNRIAGTELYPHLLLKIAHSLFLADRTNGHAICTVLRPSVVVCLSSICLSVRNVLWLNGASLNKSYYWQPIGSRIWEIDWYQNEWPWPLFRGRIKVTSTIALHLTLNISETVKRLGSNGPPIGNDIIIWAIEWSRDWWRHVTLKGKTRDPNTLRAQYLKSYLG